jgi:leukotriene-A4 hydrolase
METKSVCSRPITSLAIIALTRIFSVVFLEKLSSYEALPSAHVCHLASVYKLCETPNAEVRLRFYQVALKLDCTAPAAKRFASEAMDWVVGVDGSGVVKGRMKFCRPVFRAVYRIDRGLAVDIFVRYKYVFHPIARKLIEKVR